MPFSGSADARHEPLRHGFSRHDIDDLAALAASTAQWPGHLDWSTRAETAWSAIAEHLYARDEAPSRRDLVVAGWAAIGDHARRDNSFRGRAWGYGRGATPNFARFWTVSAGPSPGPENLVVERTALGQIWAALPQQHRRVLLALAQHHH
ncbi:hypothetical protein [Nocardiopsis ansamitocini]|uniref:Uncharacterized protein n=1 Tax=Nocardiopsis ansamitocini TaxID=1670832 RepID=A0A9W6P3R7_9ACTN|nr:hypothetical protein [Nocardiopsis ansamitocini]GLU46537.1 hypothetical protein Nans01_08880 [Nocardiopsis ansamitocini]